MLLIIDGYNVLKQLHAGEFISEKERDAFIAQLGRYSRKKKHRVILVFDGGPHDRSRLERVHGIRVVYSGAHETADEYIMQWLEDHPGKDTLLVSSDHELVLHAQELEIVSIDALAFHLVLQDALAQTTGEASGAPTDLVLDSEIDPYDLDALMEQASRRVEVKKEDREPALEPHTKGKRSKREKLLIKKIKKL